MARGLAALAATLTLAPQPANADPADAVISDDCIEMATFLRAPKDVIDSFVPDDYEPTISPIPSAAPPQPGREEADLVIRAFRCARQEVPGSVAHDRTLVQFGAVIEPYRQPSDALFDAYTFYWASDNRHLVDWMREVPGTQEEIRYSRDLRMTSTPLAPANPLLPPPAWHSLDVTDRDLSPFSLSFQAGEPLVPTPIRVNWWLNAREGKLVLSNTIPFFVSARPTAPQFKFAQGTDLARMLRDGYLPQSFVFARFRGQVTTKEMIR